MDKKLLTGGIILIVIAITGVWFFIGSSNKSTAKIAAYKTSDNVKPRIKLSKTAADLGSMKVSEDKSYDFAVKNIGNAPLQLSEITSSCGCTFGQVIYEGLESEKFGMHSQSNSTFDIAPEKEAKVRVIYSPSIMPVYGPVEREVYITTNDPANPKLTFQVKANVR